MSEDNLSRMGAASVALLVDEKGHQVIEKFPVSDVEYGFYQYAAKDLAQVNVSIPTLLFADSSSRKLRLEYIPHQIDQYTVAGDEVLSILSRLHSYPPDPSWVYHKHSWSESALEKSLELLALPSAAAQQLRHFQQSGSALFNGQCLISGDSNAGNWGRRDTGELVLFDWERFGTGSPAIDLAPLIKGMGSIQEFSQLADRYSGFSCHPDSEDLAKEIAIAKAWIVTEVILLLNERQKNDFQFYLDWYRENLPGWLNNVIKIL